MFDAKTVRAVVVADLLAFVSIAGVAWFLGFDPVPALIAGVVAGFVSGGIVLGAAARARSLGTDRSPDEPPPPATPRFPGPPDDASAHDRTTQTTDEDDRG